MFIIIAPENRIVSCMNFNHFHYHRFHIPNATHLTDTRDAHITLTYNLVARVLSPYRHCHFDAPLFSSCFHLSFPIWIILCTFQLAKTENIPQ